MPYLVLDNFSLGLDSRRHVLNSKDGTLTALKNGHITRGGEIEKRKAFSQFASLPPDTFGLETTQDKIYVFGSVTPPAMPAGVTYQRLQHPNGLAMTKVVWSTVYGGLPFVIAEYQGGSRMCFWDGAIIKDWFVGAFSASMTGVNDLAANIRSNFDVPGFTCTGSANVISIEGPNKKPFTVTTKTTGSLSTTITNTQASKPDVAAQPAQGQIGFVAGSAQIAEVHKGLRYIDGNSLPDIIGIYINGVEITAMTSGSGFRWDSVPGASGWNLGPRFAKTIAYIINANGSASGYSSRHFNTNLNNTDRGELIISATPEEGPAPNGYVVHFEFDADPSGVFGLSELVTSVVASPYTTGKFIGTFGTLQGGALNGINQVTYGNISLTEEYIPYMRDKSATAAAIIAEINAHTADHGFTAARNELSGEVVVSVFSPTVNPESYNGSEVDVFTVGNVVATVAYFITGKNGFAGQPQKTNVVISGTPQIGDTVSIYITPEGAIDPYVAGASRVAGKSPDFSITYKSKEYAAVGSTTYFSSLNDARLWDIYDIGSGFIDMSNNFGGREDLTGFGVYQDKLAVFSRRNVQLWFMDADPAQNQQLQVLANTGCVAPNSVVSMGALDVLYLADNGIRSLRAREGTDTAFANDIGSPIDSIVISDMSAASSDDVYSAKAIVEPVDGRYWLSIANKIYVLSYFPGSQINAWSTYEPGFNVDEMAARGASVFVRSGNTVYLYGGASGSEYDSSEIVVEMPYLDAKKPATYKRAKAIELTCQGQWKVYMGFDHTVPTARDLIATVNQPTFSLGQIPAVGIGTHFGMRFVGPSTGYCKLANFIVHYDELQPKHEAG